MQLAGHDVFAVDWADRTEYIWTMPNASTYDLSTVVAEPGLLGKLRSSYRLLARCLAIRPKLLLIYGYQDIALFFVAAWFRLAGTRTLSINDSKFDDYRRRWFGDIKKLVMLSPYSAFIAATRRAADYLHYLTGKRAELYYCAIDTTRIVEASRSAWDAAEFDDRYFVAIGRFIEKKNHMLLLDIFEQYAMVTANPRSLRIVGYGPLEELVRRRVAGSETLSRLVHIEGYVAPVDMPKLLGGALALLLPSREEQFGIVVTEAMSSRIPAIVSPLCGAADLVESHVSGFVIDIGNPHGWVEAMRYLGENQNLWESLSRNAERSARRADVSVFVDAVNRLVGGAR